LSILDRAEVECEIWPVVQVPDGYGGYRPGWATEVSPGVYDPPEAAPRTVRCIPVPGSFSGVGWALNQRYTEQGYASVARLFLYVPYDPTLDFDRWTRVIIDGEEWTVVDRPEFWRWKKLKFWKATMELRGDA